MSAVGMVADAIEECGVQLNDLMDEASETDLLRTLGELQQAAAHLGRLKATVESLAARTMTQKRVEFDGGVAVRHRGAKRKEWQHDDLAHAVTRASLVDPETGELPGEDVRHAVERAVSAMLKTAAVTYWRVGQLGHLGIDADEFCHSEPGRMTVDVRLGSDEAVA